MSLWSLLLALVLVSSSVRFCTARKPWRQILAELLPAAPYLQDLEFDGPLDGGARQSCVDLFVRYTQALSCQPLPPPSGISGPNITAEICQFQEGDILVNIYTPRNIQAVFHAFMQGPQILVPPITTCASVRRDDSKPSGAESIAPLTAHRMHLAHLLEGNYTLTLHAISLNFTFGKQHITPNRSPLWQVPFNITKGNSAFTEDNMQSWPTCNTTHLHGAVLSKLPLEQPLSKFYGVNQSTWKNVLHWQPKGCNLVPAERINVSSCLEDRLICFVGDSHMRFLNNAVACSADGSDLASMGACDPSKAHEYKSTKYFTYRFLDAWDLERLKNESMLQRCTDIVFNSGTWHLATIAEPKVRWTAGRFAAQLAQGLKLLKEVAPKSRLFWVTMQSHLWLDDHSQSRFPPYTELFRHIGSLLAFKHGYSIINAWDISEPLYLTSFDGSHHYYAGVVGHHILEYALNVLCVQNHTRT